MRSLHKTYRNGHDCVRVWDSHDGLSLLLEVLRSHVTALQDRDQGSLMTIRQQFIFAISRPSRCLGARGSRDIR